MTQPVNPAYYGRDLQILPNEVGVLDLDPAMLEATGIQILVQAVLARQTTWRGSAIDCPNDCLDIRGFVSKKMSSADIQQLAGLMRAEFLKDQRITAATVTIDFDPARSVCKIVESFQSAAGPFSLTLEVSAVSVTILDSSVT